MLEADLLYEVRDGIGRITFNRPQARNSLTFNMYERLAEICESAGQDAALKRRADELARLIASHAPLTPRATKQAVYRMQPKVREDEDLILMGYQSRDFREGMDAFLNKRQLQWTGE